MEEVSSQIQLNIPSVQLPSQVPVLPPRNRVKILLPILLGLIVIAIGLVYVSIQNNRNQKVNPSSIAKQPPVIPNPTSADLTSDWKIYKDDNLGFEFKYPPHLLI